MLNPKIVVWGHGQCAEVVLSGTFDNDDISNILICLGEAFNKIYDNKMNVQLEEDFQKLIDGANEYDD